MKKAIGIEEQLSRLKLKVEVEDEPITRFMLTNIGYYRLRCYLHHFIDKDQSTGKNKVYTNGTSLSQAIALYYFDYDLRMLLIRFLTNIELSIRTRIINVMSVKYGPLWYIDSNVMSKAYIEKFIGGGYGDVLSRNRTLKKSKKKGKRLPDTEFHAAWKIVEYMTLWEIVKLYENIKEVKNKEIISKEFHIKSPKVFKSYVETIRCLRNTCAHGDVLYDLSLAQKIANGPASTTIDDANRSSLFEAIKVVVYFLEQISDEYKEEFTDKLHKIYADAGALSNVLNMTIKGDLSII